MSMIVHRCRKCGHVKAWHDEVRCSHGTCRCNETMADFGPSEIVPTFDGRTSVPVTTVTEPGTTWNEGTGHRQDTCGCDDCLAVFAGAS